LDPGAAAPLVTAVAMSREILECLIVCLYLFLNLGVFLKGTYQLEFCSEIVVLIATHQSPKFPLDRDGEACNRPYASGTNYSPVRQPSFVVSIIPPINSSISPD
jgi:hypothetical protein